MLNIQLLTRLLTAAFIGIALSACDAKAPDQSWENASKGSYSAALSNDGKYSLIGSIYHGGSLWNIEQNKRLYDWNHKQGEHSAIIASAFSPDGLFAMTADHQTMVLWDTSTGTALTYWTAPNEVMSVDLSANGNYALLGLEDYSAVLFDVKRGGIKRSLYHQDRVRSVALAADSNLAITGSEDGTARLWDLETGDQLQLWQHDSEVITVAISNDGNLAVSIAKYDVATLWDTRTGKALGKLPLHMSALKRGQTFTSAEFSSTGKLLLTGNADRMVQLWKTDGMEELQRWTVPKRNSWKPTSAAIVALSFGRQSGQYYAVASNGFTHRLSR